MNTRNASLLVPVLLWIGACSSLAGPQLKEGEVDGKTLYLPEDAQPGMFISWRYEESDLDPNDTVRFTIACVNRSAGYTTMEWRRELADGSAQVTAARFEETGKCLGAWRGPSGGKGAPLRIVDTRPEMERQVKRASKQLRAVGLPFDPQVTEEEGLTEVVQTPKGLFHCRRYDLKVGFVWFSTRVTVWLATSKKLPFSSKVKAEQDWGMGDRRSQILDDYGFEGARPSLGIPQLTPGVRLGEQHHQTQPGDRKTNADGRRSGMAPDHGRLFMSTGVGPAPGPPDGDTIVCVGSVELVQA